MNNSEKAAAIGVPIAIAGWAIGMFYDQMMIGLFIMFAPFYFFKLIGWSSGLPFDFIWRRK